MLEDGKNVQSLTVIVLDVFVYNFWRRNDINKLFFSNEKWVVGRPTVKFSYILNDFKGQFINLKIGYFLHPNLHSSSSITMCIRCSCATVSIVFQSSTKNSNSKYLEIFKLSSNYFLLSRYISFGTGQTSSVLQKIT